MVGRLISQVDAGRAPSVAEAHSWIEQAFNVKISRRTVRRQLKMHGFSLKIAKLTQGRSTSIDVRADQYMKFIREHRHVFDEFERGKIWSLDFTYTSYRQTRIRRISPVGRYVLLSISCEKISAHFGSVGSLSSTHFGRKLPPRAGGAVPNYTNCIVTLLNANGGRLRPVLFTHNPAFQTLHQLRQRSRAVRFSVTARKTARAAQLRYVMRRFGIRSAQTVYLPGNGKNFARESKDVVRRFFKLKRKTIGEGDHIFRDVCQHLEAKRRVRGFTEYPPSIHETLSANDNKHHARAKAAWLHSRYYLEGDVWPSFSFSDASAATPELIFDMASIETSSFTEISTRTGKLS